MTNIAVIPARGGSKRIPGKNIREFCGKPMIAYSIETALASQLFERVIVSTDCPQIAQVAQKFGAEIPFWRPAELADDYTPTVPVMRHAIQSVSAPDLSTTLWCCIYPTAPFILAGDLDATQRLLASNTALEFVFPMTTFDYPIFRALKVDQGRVEMHFPQFRNTRSQDLPEAWHDAGVFYWGRAAAWLEQDNIFCSNTRGFPIPRDRVQDIDTPEDWAIAEKIFQARLLSSSPTT